MSAAQDTMYAVFEEQLFATALGPDHAYRKINKLIDFVTLTKPLEQLYSPLGQHGIPVVRGVKAMLLQFWEDYSDREMEADPPLFLGFASTVEA